MHARMNEWKHTHKHIGKSKKKTQASVDPSTTEDRRQMKDRSARAPSALRAVLDWRKAESVLQFSMATERNAKTKNMLRKNEKIKDKIVCV